MADAVTVPDEWLPGIDALRKAPEGAAIFLLGGVDRGKTTFTTHAARILAAEFERVAVVDCDIGQSEIGPPGTVGVARARADAERLTDLKPAGIYFVGAFSPAQVALETVTATAEAIARARIAKANRILVDTSGFVSGPAARRLKVAKAQVVAPSLILGFGAQAEIGGLLSAVSNATGAKTLRLETPAAVGRKLTALRTTRRLTRLARALENGREIDLPLREVSLVGATLGAGEPLPPELIRWSAKVLRMPLAYGESADGLLTLFLRDGVPRRDWEVDAEPVSAHFKAKSVRVLSLGSYVGAYLGLHDTRGQLLSVARCIGLDPVRDVLTVFAPPPATPERVRLVSFGRVRLNEDGSQHSDIRPGEI
jgi:polynucleotide 5'-hydroxyl-kinase GRC3/NOL9